MKDMTNRIINRIPSFYTREDGSILIQLIESIVPEIERLQDNIRVVADMVSIDKVHNDDIYTRFGSLFKLYKYSYEDDDMYRSRIRSAVASKYGGIEEIIKNNIAAYIGLKNTNLIDAYIKLYGGWEYPYDDVDDYARKPAYLMCVIDSQALWGIDDFSTDTLIYIIKNAKAAGIRVYTTMSFTSEEDRAKIHIDDEGWDRRFIHDYGDIRVYDEVDHQKIVIRNNDDTVLVISDENSVTNDMRSLTNSTFITNMFASYDVVRRND